MEFRLLNQQEKETLEMVMSRIGCTCTGASYVAQTGYHFSITPLTQATPSFRKRLESAFSTKKIVLNGRVV